MTSQFRNLRCRSRTKQLVVKGYQTNRMAGIFGRQMRHRRHNAHTNRHLFDPYDPLVNVSDLEVFQRFRFRRDTIYFIVVEVGAKLRRPQVTGTPFPLC